MHSAAFVPLILIAIVGACDAAAPTTRAATPRSAPYVPGEVSKDRPPPSPPGGPTLADPDVARIDDRMNAVDQLMGALPRTDAGAPLSSSAAACLESLRAQIAAARRAAEDVRGSVRGASQRGDNEGVKHGLTVVRVLADRATRLAAEANDCR